MTIKKRLFFFNFLFHLSLCLGFSFRTWCQWHPLCHTGLGADRIGVADVLHNRKAVDLVAPHTSTAPTRPPTVINNNFPVLLMLASLKGALAPPPELIKELKPALA